ncbi:MAG: RNA polymerase sigma factor [Ruminiclostridium sp.]|nr:RNA polymerase sigma factor [Ruminiclostridium sp.]MBQ8841457.1 RNA polymerase sigma factor [Ruminiclostridium sp.]
MENKEPLSEEILCGEYKSVFRYVMTLCKNPDEAEDITQEAFLRAIKSYDSFSYGSSLYTWLCTIAKNVWLNKCKKSGRETASEIPVETAGNDTPIDELVADKDTAFYIHKALHGLDEPYKEVFSLRIFGELNFSDISRLFGKTESWSRVTFYRAKKMIVDKLRKDGLI